MPEGQGGRLGGVRGEREEVGEGAGEGGGSERTAAAAATAVVERVQAGLTSKVYLVFGSCGGGTYQQTPNEQLSTTAQYADIKGARWYSTNRGVHSFGGTVSGANRFAC